MADLDARERLRLALSCQEKCAHLLAEAATPGNRDEQRRESLKQVSKAAQQAAARLRKRLAAERKALRKRLGRAVKQRARLVERAARGSMDAAAANNANRALSQDLSLIEAELSENQRLTNARAAVELGGFIDQPLDAYLAGFNAPGAAATGRLSWRRVLILVGIGAAILAAAWTLLILVPVGDAVFFTIEEMAPGSGRVQVTCENLGHKPVLWHVPWPEGEPVLWANSPTYGVAMHVRQAGDDHFRLVTASEDCWRYRGGPVSGSSPFTIASGQSVHIEADLHCLDALVEDIEQVRVVVSNVRGAAVETLTLTEIRP